ncbi:hypothetical protein ABID58_001597 [Bradyrhizobium sp. S3.2.6]|uniref:hypothetical protein n=1 Tax=Bradyrhizobium sp. S3.2.6 TaxID=3156428 RepID=UPI00339822F4
MPVASPLFTSVPIPAGATWTLTTLTGLMLDEAETLYGRRDMDWTLLGVEFYESATKPQISFPGSRKHVVIRLTSDTANDYDHAVWQLAQEIVHLLAPVGYGEANNLEEGLATHFAINTVHHNDKTRWQSFCSGMRDPVCAYAQPLADCEALLQLDSDIIKKLRRSQSYLSRVTAGQILQLAPACDPLLAARLTSNF